MQKLLQDYTRVILWTMIVLLIATPLYIAYDLFWRQPQKVAAFEEEAVLRGSYEFASNQCFRCHGPNGEGGVGLPLNKTADIRARDAKDPFIIKTISRGRLGTQMPHWLKEEGGPLDSEQIQALRAFILDGTHWGQYYDFDPKRPKEATPAPGKAQEYEYDPNGKTWKPTANFLKDHGLLPPCEDADIACKGKLVFNLPCVACHNTNTETKIGPGLAGIMDKDKLPNGQPVNDANLSEWIKKGSATYKKEGAPFMPAYETQVNDNDIKNLLAYLKTLKK